MKCLYCDKIIDKVSFKSLLLKDDYLCPDCRKQLSVNRKIITIEGMKVETFFEYDGMFRSMLLQYKECHDEALKSVFLYELADYINLRYAGYRLCLIPSSKKKLEERGFIHLDGIFEEVKLKRDDGLISINDLCQENKSYVERRKMLDNFVYEGKHSGRVLIADDVLTTGSTLLGAYKSISLKVDKVKVLSLAYKKML